MENEADDNQITRRIVPEAKGAVSEDGHDIKCVSDQYIVAWIRGKRVGGETMWIAIFAITTAVCAVKWLKWKTATLSLVYYIEKNQYEQPNNIEIAECTDFVVRNAVKDLVHRKTER